MNDVVPASRESVAETRPGNVLLRILGVLGPGLVTGAADDDPSGIATYSQVGAQFGYSMGWTMVLSFSSGTFCGNTLSKRASHCSPLMPSFMSGAGFR